MVFGVFVASVDAESSLSLCLSLSLSLARARLQAVNERQLEQAMVYLAEDIVYEDLTFPQAFEGKEAMRDFLYEICEGFPRDLQFVIDKRVTDGVSQSQARPTHDASCHVMSCPVLSFFRSAQTSVGLTWHVEIDGTELPFSKGCSFYHMNERGLIVYARDIVEPSIKPGHAALQMIKVVAPLLKSMAVRSDEGSSSPPQPLQLQHLALQAALASAFATYVGYLLLSTSAPGDPVWSTSAATWTSVLHKSLNFFYVNPLMNALGIHVLPPSPEHPCDEALFNIVNAWSFMFLGLYAADSRRPREWRTTGLRGVGLGVGVWLGQMFLTNVFLMPYMAARLRAEEEREEEREEEPSRLWEAIEEKSCVLGNIGLVIGGVSVAWFFLGRPEMAGEQPASGARVSSRSKVAHTCLLVCTPRRLGPRPPRLFSHADHHGQSQLCVPVGLRAVQYIPGAVQCSA